MNTNTDYTNRDFPEPKRYSITPEGIADYLRDLDEMNERNAQFLADMTNAQQQTEAMTALVESGAEIEIKTDDRNRIAVLVRTDYFGKMAGIIESHAQTLCVTLNNAQERFEPVRGCSLSVQVVDGTREILAWI